MSDVFGYVRVSTREQNVERQLTAMYRMGISPQNIYIDRESGKDFSRPRYQKMLRRVQAGMVIYIQSIDRLGRNYKEILEQWRYITKVKKADIVVLDMPLLDTRRGKDLLGTFLSDVVLQVLSFVAENERQSIRKRQAEGIAEAQKRGVRFGRPPKPLTEAFWQQFAQWQAGKATLKQAARDCGMPVSTFYAKCRKIKEKKTCLLAEK